MNLVFCKEYKDNGKVKMQKEKNPSEITEAAMQAKDNSCEVISIM